MRLSWNLMLALIVAISGLSLDTQQAEAGLFAKLFGKKCCAPEPECCLEPVCCEPEPEPCCVVEEPVCCEPAPEPVCCEPEPEPVCCEPAPEPEPCCEPAPEPECCAAMIPPPTLAPGEVLVSISPILTPVATAKVSTIASTDKAAVTLVAKISLK